MKVGGWPNLSDQNSFWVAPSLSRVLCETGWDCNTRWVEPFPPFAQRAAKGWGNLFALSPRLRYRLRLGVTGRLFVENRHEHLLEGHLQIVSRMMPPPIPATRAQNHY
jgi:hypothetical protein